MITSATNNALLITCILFSATQVNTLVDAYQYRRDTVHNEIRYVNTDSGITTICLDDGPDCIAVDRIKELWAEGCTTDSDCLTKFGAPNE